MSLDPSYFGGEFANRSCFSLRKSKGNTAVLSQQEYHREMAVSLMKSVGLDDAIDQAQRNHWQGILAELLSLPPNMTKGAVPGSLPKTRFRA